MLHIVPMKHDHLMARVNYFIMNGNFFSRSLNFKDAYFFYKSNGSHMS